MGHVANKGNLWPSYYYFSLGQEFPSLSRAEVVTADSKTSLDVRWITALFAKKKQKTAARSSSAYESTDAHAQEKHYFSCIRKCTRGTLVKEEQAIIAFQNLLISKLNCIMHIHILSLKSTK
jgi:hypothetical protein